MTEKRYIHYQIIEIRNSLEHCGSGVEFNGKIAMTRPDKVYISDNVHIGSNAYIDGRGGVFIDENTHISRNFVAHTSSHNYHGKRLPYDETYDLKPIRIERNVWIGTNVIIVPGVTIGEGAIIGAGAVVTKPVPEFAIVGNQPTRILKYRDKEHYYQLNQNKQYGGIAGKSISTIDVAPN